MVRQRGGQVPVDSDGVLIRQTYYTNICMCVGMQVKNVR